MESPPSSSQVPPAAAPGRAPAAPLAGWRRYGVPAALAIGFIAIGVLGVVSALTPPNADPDLKRLVALLADPKTRSMDLRRADLPVARVVADAENRRLLVFVRDLGAPAPGTVRVLWLRRGAGGALENGGAFRPIPILGVDHVVEQAPPLADLEEISISEEADPRVAAPTRVVASGGR